MWAPVASAALLGAACALVLLPATRLSAAPAAVPRDAWAAPAGTAHPMLVRQASLRPVSLPNPGVGMPRHMLPAGRGAAGIGHLSIAGTPMHWDDRGLWRASGSLLLAFAVFLVLWGWRWPPGASDRAPLAAPLQARRRRRGTDDGVEWRVVEMSDVWPEEPFQTERRSRRVTDDSVEWRVVEMGDAGREAPKPHGPAPIVDVTPGQPVRQIWEDVGPEEEEEEDEEWAGEEPGFTVHVTEGGRRPQWAEGDDEDR
eukprot:EG_transcript_25351